MLLPCPFSDKRATEFFFFTIFCNRFSETYGIPISYTWTFSAADIPQISSALPHKGHFLNVPGDFFLCVLLLIGLRTLPAFGHRIFRFSWLPPGIMVEVLLSVPLHAHRGFLSSRARDR